MKLYKNLKYRPDIDGLRAIAVLSVIIYHAKINFIQHSIFKGGFIGVDIFFVISGYLITSIIINQLNENNFSFKNFYERRARRILPVYLLVIFVSIPFAWLFILPINIVEFSKSIISGIFFASNFYFYSSGQVYNAESSLLIPFLHTWSLSIEEQFYLIIPLVSVIFYKYLNKNLFILIITLLLISLTYSQYAKIDYSKNFYFLSTRAWELLTGSLLAIIKLNFKGKFINKISSMYLPILGLFLITYALLFFQDSQKHPSFLTLIPIIGTSFIIYFLNTKGLVYKFLSTKILVGVGLISYSLYLWHYPIFAISRITEFTQGNIFNKLILIILIFSLSILSYLFIERPFRDKSKLNLRNFILIIFSIFSIIFFINLNIIKNKGYADRFPKIFQKYLIQYPYLDLKNKKGENCYHNKNFCNFNNHKNKQVFLIGDSQMAVLSKNLKMELIDKGLGYTDMTMGGCWYLPGSYKESVNKVKGDCDTYYQDKRKEVINNNKNSIIIIGGRLPLYLSNEHFDNKEGGVEEKGKPDNFKFLSKNKNLKSQIKNKILEIAKNNTVILIYPIPEVGWHVPLKIINETRKKHIRENFLSSSIQEKDYITTSYEVYKSRTAESFNLLNEIENKNIHRVFPHQLFCDKEIKLRCTTHNSDVIYYADDNHLSRDGAVLVNNEILKIIDKILE